MRYLIVEDDPLLSEVLIDYFIGSGHQAFHLSNGLKVMTLLEDEKFDCLLLDVNLPGKDGFSVLKALRQSGNTIPAIFMTSLTSSNDLKKGFEAGGDDYIRKPFDLDELEARLGHIQKIYGLSNGAYTLINNMTFDPQTQSVERGDETFHLSQKESALLEYFYKHPNRPIGYDEFAHRLWGYDQMPDDATIRSYIKNLRKILGEEAIRTIRGVGYVFKPL